MKTESTLGKNTGSRTSGGHFGMRPTSRGAVPEKVKEKAEMLRGYVDAINVTDNQTAVVRMSSFAACLIIKQMGLNPILQMVTRDRNRLAMQSDISVPTPMVSTPCSAFQGITPASETIPWPRMCMTWTRSNSSRWSKPCGMMARFQGGDDILNPPKMFIGAAANPFADPFELRVARLAKKVKAGADFIQTQCIYDLEKFEKWMEGVRDRGLHEKVSPFWPGLPPSNRPGWPNT